MIAYGATCTWWSEKENVAKLPNGLPCCPYCKGVLFEIEEKEWESSLEKYIKETSNPAYRELLKWLKGKCYKDINSARQDFNNE